MGELTVSRWHRYGKQRLYVNDPTGERVGWYDLATGVSTLERDDLAEDFASALSPHIGVGAFVPDEPAPAELADPEPATIEPQQSSSFEDLTERRPGEAVRAKADEEWQARKHQSKLRAYAGRLLDAKTDERAWRRGAEGEEVIGKDLERLRSRGWLVLHSVPVGKDESDIDHVLVGPGGVFTINTKNHIGKRVHVTERGIWVSGHRTFYDRNSRHEAERASRLLTAACHFPVDVRALVVIRSQEFRRKAQPDGVTVLSRQELLKWLKKRPQILAPEALNAIYAQARNGEIWRS